MKLSPIERRLFARMLRTPLEEVGVEDLVEAAYEGRKKPKNARAATTVMMRSLSMKSIALPFQVERCSDLGRGNTAKYRLKRRKG